MSVEVAVLGPLELRVDGAPVDVPGPRRRAVLALLAMARGDAVSMDRIVDGLWDGDPPQAAVNSAQSHVSRLRRHLGRHADALQRTAAGYRLRLDALDADRADELATRGRTLHAAEPATAAACFDEALSLWRGDPLAEFAGVAPLAAEAVRMTELRRTLVDDLLAAQLAYRRPEEVAVSAASAAAAEPYRESTHRVLMVALARSGRTADALDVGRTYRARLADSTGLDPTPELRALQDAIARGELDPPPVGHVAPVVPRPTTPLLGRVVELGELQTQLASERCVTITGPAGVGKTRLALEVAAILSDQRHEPVWFVELAPVHDADAVPRVVADALGARGSGPVTHDIAEAVAGRGCVLFLDNCEHLVAAVRRLCERLLQRCPQLTVAATSRVPLGVAGEAALRLDPLATPDAMDVIAGTAATAPPVLLFADRARRARAGFVLTSDNLVAVAHICRRLDGLPLAIELAASRLTGLGLSDLAARLDAGLDVVVGSRRGDGERHTTLRSAIAWSYALLDDEERRLFRALAVFPGWFELSAAEHVGNSRLHDHVTDHPATTLSRLVDASMVAATEVAGGLAYRMLDSIRAFGRERLREHGEHDAAVAAMSDWTVAFVTRARHALQTPDEPEWAARVERCWATVRAARQHLLEHGQIEDVARMHVELEDHVFWGERAEPWTWAIADADLPALRGTPVEAAVLATAAQAAWRLGDLDRARDLVDRALAAGGDAHGRALARFQDSVLRMFAGEYRTASQTMAAAGDVDPSRRALFCATAALAAGYAGDTDDAFDLLDRAEHADHGGAPTLLAFLAHCRGEVCAAVGDAGATAHLRRAVDLARTSGATFVVATATLTLATVTARAGDLHGACAHFGEVIRYWQRTGSWTQQWTTLRNVAEVLAQLGDAEHAALLLLAAADDADAAALTGDDAARLGALRDALQARLDPAEFDRLRQRAATLPRTAVVDAALAAITAVGGGRAARRDGRDGATA